MSAIFSEHRTQFAAHRIYWWLQREADVPEDNDWLSPRESSRLAGLRIAKRRCDWRLGRWTAKHAIALYHDLPDDWRRLAQIEILAGDSGAPEVFIHNQPALSAISLSHRSGAALCCIATRALRLGCDLELIEPRNNTFLTDYFTHDEQELIGATPAQRQSEILAVLWSAKESALKAMQTGLRLDTRDVSVERLDTSSAETTGAGTLSADPPQLDGWRRLRVVAAKGLVFPGWWKRSDGLVWTVVSSEETGLPIRLRSVGPAVNEEQAGVRVVTPPERLLA